MIILSYDFLLSSSVLKARKKTSFKNHLMRTGMLYERQ